MIVINRFKRYPDGLIYLKCLHQYFCKAEYRSFSQQQQLEDRKYENKKSMYVVIPKNSVFGKEVRFCGLNCIEKVAEHNE